MFELSDLFLAFRQGKSALASERWLANPFGFSQYERKLSENLHRLRSTLGDNNWFTGINIGAPTITPKSSQFITTHEPNTVSIGLRNEARIELKVQPRLAPTPEFVVAEVLYLWRFGPVFEELLVDECVAYRLSSDRYLGRPFAPWYQAYSEFQSAPIDAAQGILHEGEYATIISTDMESCFDSISPLFLLSRPFVDRLEKHANEAGLSFSRDEYVIATRSLIANFKIYGRRVELALGIKSDHFGLPIGSLTARLFANAALADLDRHLLGSKNLDCYRRYVDDIVLVFRHSKPPETEVAVAQRLVALFPNAVRIDSDIVFSTDELEGLRLSNTKTRIHHLHGEPGTQFLKSIRKNYSVVASERRAFVGDADRLFREFETLIETSGERDDNWPRLRDADRFSLRRALGFAYLESLRRIVALVAPAETRKVIDKHSAQVLAALTSNLPLLDLDFALELVQLETRSGSRDSELFAYLTRLASVAYLRGRIGRARWGRRTIDASKAAALVADHVRGRLSFARISAGANAGDERARAVVGAGLDFLGEAGAIGEEELASEDEYEALLPALRSDEWLRNALTVLESYVKPSTQNYWRARHPVQLLLLPFAPQFADVALSLGVEDEMASDLDRVSEVVDVLRGTAHQKRLANMRLNPETNELNLDGDVGEQPGSRVLLGNLHLDETAFDAAVDGEPQVTLKRLRVLDELLRDAMSAKKGVANLLVLPELSVPRAWVGMLAHYAFDNKLAIVAGVEYGTRAGKLANEAVGLFPLPYGAGAIVYWTKGNPAAIEAEALGDRFYHPPNQRRLVVSGQWGRMSVAICSELLEAHVLAELRSKVEVLLVPAWNKDAPSFEHAVHAAASLLVHAYVCVANNAHSSDSRIASPIREPRHLRDLVRIVHRGESRVVWADLNISELRKFHASAAKKKKNKKPAIPTMTWFPLPPSRVK